MTPGCVRWSALSDSQPPPPRWLVWYSSIRSSIDRHSAVAALETAPSLRVSAGRVERLVCGVRAPPRGVESVRAWLVGSSRARERREALVRLRYRVWLATGDRIPVGVLRRSQSAGGCKSLSGGSLWPESKGPPVSWERWLRVSASALRLD